MNKMTKQEEIRGGIVDRFQNLWTVQTYEEKVTLANYILNYLHSQGVVITKYGFYSDLMEPLVE